MRSTWSISIAMVAAFAAGTAVGALQQQAPRTRREPQFENEHVRVWKSIILPNQPLAVHRHDHGRTIVALKGGTLDVVDAKGVTLKKMTWESGKAYWLGPDPPGEQHGDMNRGPEPIEVMVVEMRGGAAGSTPGEQFVGTWTGTWDGPATGGFELTLEKGKDGVLGGRVSVTGEPAYKATLGTLAFDGAKMVATYDFPPDPTGEVRLEATFEGNTATGNWWLRGKSNGNEAASGGWKVTRK